jgi:voltage-gated potassium channel
LSYRQRECITVTATHNGQERNVDEKDRLENLRTVLLFSRCSEETLKKILDIATEFEAAAGHVLVERDQPGAGLFVLEEGKLEVQLPHRRLEVGPGEFVGELALLDETSLHTARVSALTPVRALAISRDDFIPLLEDDPHIALSMLRVVAARLARLLRE